MAARTSNDPHAGVYAHIGESAGELDSLTQSYSGTSSAQMIAADLTLAAGAGTSDPGDSAFLAAMMGNLLGASLTKTHNYLAGMIGAYSVTGVRATTYPTGALMGIVMDGVGAGAATELDAAVMAVIDGDSAVTRAKSAFGVMSNNSTPGSGFSYGLDLYSPAHDGYGALAILTADIRLNSQALIMSGAVDPSAGAGLAAAQGSMYLRTNGGAATSLYIKTGALDTDWTAK